MKAPSSDDDDDGVVIATLPALAATGNGAAGNDAAPVAETAEHVVVVAEATDVGL